MMDTFNRGHDVTSMSPSKRQLTMATMETIDDSEWDPTRVGVYGCERREDSTARMTVTVTIASLVQHDGDYRTPRDSRVRSRRVGLLRPYPCHPKSSIHQRYQDRALFFSCNEGGDGRRCDHHDLLIDRIAPRSRLRTNQDGRCCRRQSQHAQG
jgi:hypothetical protein